MGFTHARTLDDGRVVGGYARIWAVEDKCKYSTAEVSTSRKNQDGTYETDFQNKFVRLVGNAHELGKSITEPVNIQIKNCDVTRYWSKEKEKEYINFTIFDFDIQNGGGGKTSAPKTPKADDDFMKVDESDEEQVPWL
jgi:hypothetical protein